MIRKLVNSKGFTTLELIVVVSLIALLTTIVLLGLGTIGGGTSVEAVGDDVTASFRDSQNNSQAGVDGSKWGVHLEFPANGNHSHTVFKGESWTSGGSATASGKKSLPKGFTFGGINDVNINGCATETSFYCDVVFNFDGSTVNYGLGAVGAALSVFGGCAKVDISVSEGGLIEALNPVPGGPRPPECADGADNDLDGKVDTVDPGCSGSSDETESPDPSWTTPSDIWSGMTARKVSHVTGNDGFPMIAFYSFTSSPVEGKVQFIKCNTLLCTGQTPEVLDSGSSTDGDVSLKLDSNGLPRILHTKQVGGSNVKLTVCGDVQCSSANRTTNTVSSDNSFFVGLDLQSDNHPRTSHYNTGSQTPYFGICPDEDCSPAPSSFIQIDASTQSGIGISQLIIGAVSHFVHYDVGAGRLRYANCSSSSCSQSDVETGLSTVNSFDTTSIAKANDNNPSVVWNNNLSGGYKVRFLHCNSNCSNTTSAVNIDSHASSRLRFPSMRVGSDGKPRIAWSDFTIGKVRYAQCANGDCSSYDNSPADAVTFGGADTGEPAPLALALYQNNPRIVYYDNFNNKLRITWR